MNACHRCGQQYRWFHLCKATLDPEPAETFAVAARALNHNLEQYNLNTPINVINVINVTRDDQIQLGDKVRDTVTGFTGIATARVEYISGCVRYAVTPQVGEDNKMLDAQYCDWQTMVVLEEAKPVRMARTGGPHPAPARQAPPTR
jgi:hypothetical protein